jgi:hypothetical protein
MASFDLANDRVGGAHERTSRGVVDSKTDELVLQMTSTGAGIPVMHSWFLDQKPGISTGGC